MLVSALKATVTTLYTAETLGDALFLEHLRSALAVYNKHNPIRKSVDLATVAGQSDYTLGEPFLYVESVLWYPGGGVAYGNFEFDPADLPRPTLPYRGEPSVRIIERFNNYESYRARQGLWELRGQTIRLFPTPTNTGDTISVDYAVAHVLTVEDSELATVPDADFEVLRDLILAEILDRQAINKATEDNYKEGLQQVAKQHSMEALRQEASRLRSRALATYERTAVGAG